MLEKRLAEQVEALKRVNAEIRAATQASTPSVSSSAAPTSATITAPRASEPPAIIQEIKQESDPITLNTTAAQMTMTPASEVLESNKRKRTENISENELPESKVMRTELAASPSSTISKKQANGASTFSIPSTSATMPVANNTNSQNTQAINQDDSFMANFFGNSQPTSTPNGGMRMEEDQDIDLNDMAIDLMAESSQSQNTHVDAAQPARNKAASNQQDNAMVAGLMNNMQKLLKAYSIIVPEQAEMLQTSMNDPASLAAIDLVRKFSFVTLQILYSL